MILIDKYIKFITENKITQEQYLLLHLLKDKRMDLIKQYKQTFPTEEGTMLTKNLIDDLISREFLVKTKTGFKLGDKFIKIFTTGEVATDEIYDIYPAFIESEKGVSIPLISMDKKVFKELYIPKIYGNVEEHKEVLADIKYGVENNLIKMGINKFLTSEQWKVLRKLREQKNITMSDIHDDSFS